MANEQRIDDIISPKAFEQLERLQNELQKSADLYAKFGAKILDANKEIGETKSFEDLQKIIDKQTQIEAKAIGAKAKLLEAENKLIAAKQRQIKLAEQQVAAELKSEAAARSRATAAQRIAENETKALDSVYDANMMVVKSEEALGESRKNAEAAARSAAAEESRLAKVKKDQSKDFSLGSVYVQDAADSLEAYGVSLNGAINQGIELRKDLKQLQVSFKEVGDNATPQQIIDYETAQRTLKLAIQENNTETKRLIKEQVSAEGSLERMEARLASLRTLYKSLSKEEQETSEQAAAMVVEIEKLTKAVKDGNDKLGVHNMHVGDYGRALQFLPPQMQAVIGGLQEISEEEGKITFKGIIQGIKDVTKSALAFIATPIGATIAAVSLAIGGAKMWYDYNKGLQEATKLTNDFTGLAGDDLINMRAQVEAISSVYGKDFKDVLTAVNSTAQQFGISYNEALTLVRDGFISGADASGDFMNQLKEYPTQLDAVGLSAEQTVSLISQNVKSGIFSDKGIDSIKEGGIRLREMTKATREALDGIGLSSDKIAKDLESGQTSIFDVIQQVSGRLSELPPQSAAVGTAIADIFGGAGEDAGLRYLATLKDINLNLGDTIDETDDLVKAQRLQLETTEILKAETAALFDATGGGFELLIANAKYFVTDLLVGMIRGVKDLYNWFAELYNGTVLLRGAIAAIEYTYKSLYFTAKELFNLLFEGFKTTASLIKAVVTGDLGAIPGVLKNAFSNVVSDFKQYGEDSSKAFTDAFNKTVNGRMKTISLNSNSGGSSALDEAVGSGRVGGTQKPTAKVDQKAIDKANKEAEKAAEKRFKDSQELEKRILELSLLRLEGEKDIANRSAAVAREVATDELNAQSDRLNNLHTFLESRRTEIDKDEALQKEKIKKYSIEITELEKENRIEEAKQIRLIMLAENESIQRDINDKRAQLAKEGNSILLSIYKSGAENAVDMVNESLTAQYNESLKILSESRKKGAISEREYNESRANLSKQLTLDIIQNEIDQVQTVIDLAKMKGINVSDQEKKLAKLKIDLSNEVLQNDIENNEKAAEKAKYLRDAKFKYAKEAAQMAFETMSMILEGEVSRVDREQEVIDAKFEREKVAIENSVATEEQKAAALSSLAKRQAVENEQLERKKAALVVKQARLQKANDVMSVIGNTSVAIMRAYADLGPIGGTIFAAIIGTLGAIQLNSIISQPLPQYYKGTSGSKEGFAHVGERGSELMIEPNGNMMLTPSTDTVTYLQKGTKILTHEQTKRALAKGTLRGMDNRPSVNNDFRRFAEYNDRNTDKIVKAVSKTKSKGTFITKTGWNTTQINNDKFNNYLRKNGM